MTFGDQPFVDGDYPIQTTQVSSFPNKSSYSSVITTDDSSLFKGTYCKIKDTIQSIQRHISQFQMTGSKKHKKKIKNK